MIEKFIFFMQGVCMPLSWVKGKRFVPQYATRIVKHRKGDAMLWVVLLEAELVTVLGILNQKNYHYILQHHAKPPDLRLLGQGFLPQQDNDPKNPSRPRKNHKTRQYAYKRGVGLKLKEKRKQPISATHLWKLQQQCWRGKTYRAIFKFPYKKNATMFVSAKGGCFDESKKFY